MKGYIYRLYGGSDPAKGWIFNDPIFGSPPTLGACVPNLRRAVDIGDWVFCISGRVATYQPYVVGGFRVEEKISALQAFQRFPEYRLGRSDSGQNTGNVIVDETGGHHHLDDHDNFEGRVENYLVGGESFHVSEPHQIDRARSETVPVLSKIFNKPANRSFDIVPRWRRMEEAQIDEMNAWLKSLT